MEHRGDPPPSCDLLLLHLIFPSLSSSVFQDVTNSIIGLEQDLMDATNEEDYELVRDMSVTLNWDHLICASWFSIPRTLFL